MPADIHESVNDLSKDFSEVDGARDVSSALSKARRALKSKSPDRDKALAEYDEALEAFEADKVWRLAAEAEVKPALESYLEAIKGTLGARQQPRLSREQALYMASCTAVHQDISLNF